MAASSATPSPMLTQARLSQAPETARALLHQPWHARRLALGDGVLDAFLSGGIDATGITEVAGEAGVGKTQLALQLMLQAQLPLAHGGLGGGAMYLHGDTANVDPTMKRLSTMAAAFASKHAALGAEAERLKNSIYVLQVDSPEDLWRVIDERVPPFVNSNPVRLIVIDSLGGLYRGLQESGGPAASALPQAEVAKQRALEYMKLAARLKQIGDSFNVAVVVLNQVTDKPFDATQQRAAAPWERGPCATTDGGARVPALGPAWASCVNMRLVLTRAATALSADAAGMAGAHQWQRGLHVAWSPRLSGQSVALEVAESGLVGIP